MLRLSGRARLDGDKPSDYIAGMKTIKLTIIALLAVPLST